MGDNEIWVIDNEHDDHEILEEIADSLKIEHKLRFFDDPKKFLSCLGEVSSAPFIIICCVHLAGPDGFKVRERLLKEPNKKFHSVPFIYLSNHASESQINKAYRDYAHGFFVKPDSIQEWRSILRLVLSYWSRCKMPSKHDTFDAPLA